MHMAVIYAYTSTYTHIYVELKASGHPAAEGKGAAFASWNRSCPMTKTVIKHYGGMHPQGE